MRVFSSKAWSDTSVRDVWVRLSLLVGLSIVGLPLLGLQTRADALKGASDTVVDDKTGDDKSTIIAVIDRARLVKVPEGTETLVIGNPTIADVTMLQQKNLMVLTPKAFGETNFIALDRDGNPVAESTIEVVGGVNALVVQRGMDRESYSCAPRCQPTERLGDDDKYMSAVAAQVQQHNSRLAGVTPPTGVSLPSH